MSKTTLCILARVMHIPNFGTLNARLRCSRQQPLQTRADDVHLKHPIISSAHHLRPLSSTVSHQSNPCLHAAQLMPVGTRRGWGCHVRNDMGYRRTNLRHLTTV